MHESNESNEMTTSRDPVVTRVIEALKRNRAISFGVEAQDNNRMQRRLQQIESPPPEERRQIRQLLDAFIEHGQLKRRAGQTSG